MKDLNPANVEAHAAALTPVTAMIEGLKEKYQPLTGEGYSKLGATRAWGESMDRARHEGPHWILIGGPGTWKWRWSNFKPWISLLTIEDDGFHWQVTEWGRPEHVLDEGVTTSLYEAYQSCVQGRKVERAS